MSRTRTKRRNQLTDAQIREKIGDMLALPEKPSHLTAAVAAISVFAVVLCFAGSPEFTETGRRWALVLWITNLLWVLVAAFGWKTRPLESLKRLPKEQQHHHLRSETIWFHFWKGGYLALLSMIVLMTGLAALSHLGPIAWVSGLAVGGYLLIIPVSLLQRRRILRVVVEGWSADTRWGRVMLRLAIIGPAAGASIGSAIGIILVRLHILPASTLLASAGIVGILVAGMIVPQVVQDFSVARIHLQIRKGEANRTTE